jgi:YD repeat-containing protein
MTSRTNRFWSRTDTFTANYLNNRRQGIGISYDAEGNLTQETDLQYVYDAAGRSAAIINSANNKTISPVYDGDGQVVYRTETEGSTTIPNFFQLKSTVMGGRVITELDSQGQKKKGYVYCNGQLIAQQDPLWIVWQHDNPFTGTRASSNRDGQGNVQVDPDPMGVDLGSFDPYIEPELWEPSPEGMVGLLPGSGIPSGRCILDGMAIECWEAGNLLQSGAAEFEQPTTVWTGDRWSFVHYDRATGQHVAQGRALGWQWTSGPIVNGEHTGGVWEKYYERIVVGGGAGSVFGSLPLSHSPFLSFLQTPQNSTMIPLGDLRGNMEKLLTGDCLEYTTKLLAEAAKLFAGNYPHLKTIMEGYEKITAPGQGGYVFKTGGYDTVSGNLFGNGASPGTVQLLQSGQFHPPSAKETAFYQAIYAYKAVHETFHLASQNGYDDEQMATAAYSLAKRKMEPVPANITGLARASIFSSRFDDELKKHCAYPK